MAHLLNYHGSSSAHIIAAVLLVLCCSVTYFLVVARLKHEVIEEALALPLKGKVGQVLDGVNVPCQ